MIFDPDALLQLAAQLAAKQAIPLPLTREAMGAIVDDAERLADGDERDEPAALFYACALRAAAFGKIATPFFDDIAAAQAAAVGLKLDASELDLILLRGRIAFAAVGWESVRHDFAGWLRSANQEPTRTAPKRPQ
jgi:hypothetical protein